MLLHYTKRQVLPAGLHFAKLLAISERERAPFGAPEGSTEKNPCINWKFGLFSDEACTKHKADVDGSLLWAIQQTGVDYGGGRSKLTQLLTNICGRKLTEDEVGRFDVSNLLGLKCQLVIELDTKPDGEVISKIGNVIVGTPFPIAKYLMPGDPFTNSPDHPQAATSQEAMAGIDPTTGEVAG